MDTPLRPRDEADGDESSATVTVCESRPGRVVFTEEDNSEAWIATDLTVDVPR
jgi:hypothetical protein